MTMFCKLYNTPGSCPNGDLCRHLHRPVCTRFILPGGCPNRSACEYQHVQECRYFNTPNGCRNGLSCRFPHRAAPTFHQSHYKRAYDAMGPKPQQRRGASLQVEQALRDNLGDEVGDRFFSLHYEEGLTTAQSVIALWCEDVGVFRTLNDIIIADDARQFQLGWMTFIRILTAFLTRQDHCMDRDRVVWRASSMTRLQADRLFPDMVIRPPMFVSTSALKSGALKLMRRNKRFLLRIHVPAGCRNAAYVDHLSQYQQEHEILIPPYSPFEVISVDFSRCLINLRLLDGMQYESVERRSGISAPAFPL
ncbi:uncharacterized protein MONBRDRAFT_8545 [Monosiga brevicollis MX1]|uniref:C3H1-type domain-containing protein n=1 Tax=Monosiga brevicollis TaxID=81824 RepID=A9V0C4_MONBE|nr:uncharacterized protein MONBRDRAFT_8545 [Monosiga brevicollis MX1]EDQ88986.1 predicted protein [Monosiga brevicollis MX1]|eukprot:XP_001746091.1 hypothetical protein [Monosiga brevicollis MX1]